MDINALLTAYDLTETTPGFWEPSVASDIRGVSVFGSQVFINASGQAAENLEAAAERIGYAVRRLS